MMPFVIKEFLHIFPPLKIIEHKEDRIVVICKEGIKIELSSVSSYNFDAVLHFTTGSKHYISNLNKYAANEELVVKDDGVYKIGTDKKFLCETEQEIYDTLKLQYIPPELREDNVEVIKKAKRYEIPSLVNLSDLKGDLHVHTTWSDGTVSVEELVQWARNKGYEYIGICDHFRPSRSTTRKGITIDNVTNLIEHVRYMRNKFYGINILVGLEVEIRKGGSLGINDELLSMFDFVIGGVHSGFDAGVEAVTDRLVAGCRHPLIDIIAHPASRMIGRRDCFVNIDKLLEAAAETDTVLEINSYIVRLDLPDIYVYQAKQNGIKFVVNTDAHTMEELNMIEYGVLTARRGWLESDDVINTLPYERLKYVLKRNKYKGLSV
jgi:DNA polymerase (family 10)